MKIIKTLPLLIPLAADASTIAQCEGTVLQRRLALAELGARADAFATTGAPLAHICRAHVNNAPEGQPHILRNSLVCDSSSENTVFYLCELERQRDNGKQQVTLIMESCSYSLKNQTVNCENNAVVTTFTE